MGQLLSPDKKEGTRPFRLHSEPLLTNVSVVVPVGPGDVSWHEVIFDLCKLSTETELLVVATEPEPRDFRSLLSEAGLQCDSQWLESPPGRARQMNLGSSLAQRKYLWFLHADSRLSTNALEELDQALANDENSLWYFDLKFRDDGPDLTRINAIGASFRTRMFGLPFGDQGFCLRRKTFQQLGGYSELAAYGEDHLFVWAARRQGITLQRVNAAITTSARKYARDGWLRTTAKHLWLTCRQALPAWWRHVKRPRPKK